jgi:hypothetical protein
MLAKNTQRRAPAENHHVSRRSTSDVPRRASFADEGDLPRSLVKAVGSADEYDRSPHESDVPVETKIPPFGYLLLLSSGSWCGGSKVWQNCFFSFDERRLLLFTCKEQYLENKAPKFNVALDSRDTIVSAIAVST